jgi:hypothetical protein
MSQIQLFKSNDGNVSLEVSLNNDTVWLTQAQMADLFGTKRPAITKHLGNIFNSDELVEEVVSSILEQTTAHGALPGKTQTKGNSSQKVKRLHCSGKCAVMV